MVRVIHNRVDYETGNRFDDEVQTVEPRFGGEALISVGQPEGFTPLLLSSLLSSYIDSHSSFRVSYLTKTNLSVSQPQLRIIRTFICLTRCQSRILGERKDIEIINLYLNRDSIQRRAVSECSHTFRSPRLYLFLFDTLKHQDDSVERYHVLSTNTFKWNIH